MADLKTVYYSHLDSPVGKLLIAATGAGLAAHGLAALVHGAYVARSPHWWLIRLRRRSRVAVGPLDVRRRRES